jgi:hypothetical protein
VAKVEEEGLIRTEAEDHLEAKALEVEVRFEVGDTAEKDINDSNRRSAMYITN